MVQAGLIALGLVSGCTLADLSKDPECRMLTSSAGFQSDKRAGVCFCLRSPAHLHIDAMIVATLSTLF